MTPDLSQAASWPQSAQLFAQLFAQFLALSLLAIGGAISTAPDMHRSLVTEHGWLSDAQFNASIALAQAAPGPNVLFVALMGWHVGLNMHIGPGGLWGALAGVACTMVGIMLPSTTFTWLVTRWAHRNREHMAVRAFKTGMGPIVIGLFLATAWVLVAGSAPSAAAAAAATPALAWPAVAVAAACALSVWLTRVHMLWLLGAGALAGAVGWV